MNRLKVNLYDIKYNKNNQLRKGKTSSYRLNELTYSENLIFLSKIIIIQLVGYPVCIEISSCKIVILIKKSKIITISSIHKKFQIQKTILVNSVYIHYRF